MKTKKLKRLTFGLTVGLIVLMLAQTAWAAAKPLVTGTTESKTITSSAKINVLNKTLQLTYPKNNTLVDNFGREADNKSVSFTVYLDGEGGPDVNTYTLVSNIYKISVADSVYSLLHPGQLTLAYDPGVSSSVADQLSIWYTPKVTVSEEVYWEEVYWNGESVNLGGISNTGKKSVTVPFQFSGDEDGYYAVFLAQRLFQEFAPEDDQKSSESDDGWSYTYVMPLWAKGIIEPLPTGSSDYKFGLSNSVNRLEFATMLVRGLGLELTKRPNESMQIFRDTFGDTFSDGSINFCDAHPENIDPDYFGENYRSSGYIYDSDRMPIQYVETAASKGIINGFPDQTFRPQDELTREQAAVIMARITNQKLSDDMAKVTKDLGKLYENADRIAPWAAPAVLAATKAKLIEGEPGENSKLKNFNPNGKLKRSEAITLTYRLLKKLKKI